MRDKLGRGIQLVTSSICTCHCARRCDQQNTLAEIVADLYLEMYLETCGFIKYSDTKATKEILFIYFTEHFTQKRPRKLD